jgi:hypothetical protein
LTTADARSKTERLIRRVPFSPDWPRNGLLVYLEEDLFRGSYDGLPYNCRFRAKFRGRTDIIVASHDRELLGCLYAVDPHGEEPDEAKDRRDENGKKWPRIYVVSKFVEYKRPVNLDEVGLGNIHFPALLSEAEFVKIESLSGGCDEFPRHVDPGLRVS